ncbi:uncharacterized protein LOC114727356 [Neltuma alba]|uniref:uncharacterized protein LOC114727356 n=1 Tax=Neltuma alba TaxID=207710 RepID=UPI0010A45BDD|nr:uncharacterized protein LOC114727356 [Prosopis alba]
MIRDDFLKAVVAYVCWYIWKARCGLIFENKNPDLNWILIAASTGVNELWRVKRWSESHSVSSANELEDMVWSPPPPNSLKLNVDGSFVIGTNRSGVGFVLRDAQGQVVDLFCQKGRVLSAFESEAEALHQAIFRYKDRELGKVDVESDCLPLVKAIKENTHCPDWKANGLVADLKGFFASYTDSSLSFVPRKCNLVADWLAKSGCKGMWSFGWELAPPSPLLILLTSDRSNCREGIG